MELLKFKKAKKGENVIFMKTFEDIVMVGLVKICINK